MYLGLLSASLLLKHSKTIEQFGISEHAWIFNKKRELLI